MRRPTPAVCAVVLLLSLSVASRAVAAGQTNWTRHDTAVYVVSTLNLLHTRDGRPVAPQLQQKLDVTKFEVWEDLNKAGLYFVELRRNDSTLAGALAYQMGWPQPLSVSLSLRSDGVHRAPKQVARAFRVDTKRLMESFSTTNPSA